MKLDTLQSAMIAAMKARDKARKDSIAVLVSAVKKAGIDAGCRDNIPEEIVDKAVLKELKTVKEQIDSCPKEREDLMAEYQARYDVISEFAPQMMDAAQIEAYLLEHFAEVVATKNKGMIMKNVMADLKGKADGKVIGEVVAKLCQ
ncbi:MAG: GatB/YqeY domain-containing protein [Lachnospiraceae bacterium]|nr:GatB/YqeY domain-containing protein [Lachnospiraceae bacterium]MBP5221626.1 GatB/YqeY domain-containing protein [Lachnospiraceae bacterium]